MKKVTIFGVAILALAACNKSQTVSVPEQSGEIAIKAVNAAQTKGGEIAGTTFAGTNTMKVSASAEEQDIYFTNVAFTKDETDGRWKANPTKQYWPAGEKRVDFLAYGLKTDATLGVEPAFDATRPADMLTVANWDVYQSQVDFLYAAANNKFKDGPVSPVAMTFQHATALLIFNFRVSQGPDITITNIKFPKLVKQGTAVIDNTKTKLQLSWAPADAAENVSFPDATTVTAKSDYNVPEKTGLTYGTLQYTNSLIGYGNKYVLASETGAEKGWYQLEDSFLIVPQERQSFIISYKIGTDDTVHTFESNLEKGEWKAGNIYFYNIDFNLREITIAPSVAEWTVGVTEEI